MIVDATVAVMGTIDILVSNAAYQMMENDISELSEEQQLHTFDTNIHPYFYFSKYALPHMKSGNTIISNASINAYIGRPDPLDYTSTKEAIISFTCRLSNQQFGKGIRVNTVLLGPSTNSKVIKQPYESPSRPSSWPDAAGTSPPPA